MTESKPLPCVLFVSSCEKKPEEIVKLIINKLDESITLEEDVSAHPWHVDTKYYKADVYLCTLENKALKSQQFSSRVHGVVLYFDCDKDKGLEAAESWLPFLNEYDAEVKILLCSNCKDIPEVGVSKLTAQEWCVKKGFELVELDPDVDAEWEAEQDFLETTGIKRVVQALQAHVWPNLSMKERKEPTSFNNLLHGGIPLSDGGDLSEGFGNLSIGRGLEQANIQEKMEELLGGGGSADAEMDFATLFGELHDMKERVQAMPSDQRKACAEQVVLAFWKAIGGDSDELDLPDDE
ncbi:alpha- and gamma-adaptin-binding protein p34 [Nilaparvata lugens]|uniref:alpha- and gamma-adaptin-binding protein p34 n=1 Tax=Nilaparvata lugens TaxID=108931 RepID=UPI000B9811AF|nr:alpha- and gamma-adaptin-binding protein p34 [Nilaparvata lugens]